MHPLKTKLKLASDVKIFAGTASMDLASKIALEYGTTLGQSKVTKFSDGELQPSFEETVRGCNVYIVQSTIPPADNLLELLMMIDAAKRASARRVVAVIPYFGFARQDRKDNPRVPIGAKLVANLLTAAGVSRIMTMDLHADQIQGFFDLPVDHLYASKIFLSYIQSLDQTNLIMAAPDVGGSKRANSYAKYLNVDMAICYKQRKAANVIQDMTVIGDIEGKDVIIIDDMVDTGGTLCKAAGLMVNKGAKSVRALCTHAVLSGNAIKNIEDSAISELVVTDTIPPKFNSPKLKVLSVANLFAKVIYNNVHHESISSHFVF